MTKNAIFEVPKIPNSMRKDKVQTLLLCRVRLTLVLVFFSSILALEAQLAQALPVAIAWEVPIRKGEVFNLEIAKDPNFSQVVLNAKVNGKDFGWDAPAEGIYHWRLLRPSQKLGGGEGSTFISGSFAAIDSKIVRQNPARLSWNAVPGADRYKLYVLEEAGKRRSMITTATTFFVPRTDVSQMVEVVPYSSGAHPVMNVHFNPSLTLSAANSQMAAVPIVAPAVVAPVVAPSPKPLAPVTAAPVTPAAKIAVVPVIPVPPPEPEVVTPTPLAPPPPPGLPEVEKSTPPKLDPKTAKPMPEPDEPDEPGPAVVAVEPPPPKPTPPPPPPVLEPVVTFEHGRRLHLVQVFALYNDERLQAQKLEIDLQSRDRQAGIGASMWANPASGLLVGGQVSYFEHHDKVSQSDVFSEDLSIDAARYTADLGLGWNLLHGFDTENHLLTASLLLGAAQLPLLPLEFDGEPGSVPHLTSEQLNLIGGGLAYGYFIDRGGVQLETGLLVDSDEEAKMTFVRLQAELYFRQRYVATFGLYQRHTEVTRCHEDAALCLREGKVTTNADELGLTLGIGMVSF